MQIAVEKSGKTGIIVQYHITITGTFGPNTGLRVIAIIGQTFQTPLTDTGTVEYIIYIISAPLTIRISVIILQHKADIHHITSLHQIPVVVGNPVGNDIVRPFFESAGINFHTGGIMFLQIIIQKVVQRNEIVKNVFVNHLKRTHTHQCLLMSMIQIDRNITIINALHISIEYASCQSRVFFVIGHPIKESSIARNPNNLTVQALNITSGFRRMHFL